MFGRKAERQILLQEAHFSTECRQDVSSAFVFEGHARDFHRRPSESVCVAPEPGPEAFLTKEGKCQAKDLKSGLKD